MAKYTKQEWVDNETLINADKLNHIEDGIANASEDADSALEKATDAENTAITGIKVNGESATVNNHVAEIEVVADVPIEHIEVNGTEQPIEDKTVNIEVPSKTSELDNDSDYITGSELNGYARQSDIPTKVSALTNDSGYITNDALDGYAKESDVPTKTSELTNDSGYITQPTYDANEEAVVF